MRALVIGSSGGIGAAMVTELSARGMDVTGLSRSADGLDVTDEGSVCRTLGALLRPFGVIFVATGALVVDGYAPEKAIRDVTAEGLLNQVRVNAVGPMLVLKHALPLLPHRERSVFAALSARVGSIGDNRLGGWHGYRSAKAALNQLVHGASVELRRTHPGAIAVCLHPGTVATPFTEAYASRHVRVPADTAAARLADVIGGLKPGDTGGFFDQSGQRIPW